MLIAAVVLWVIALCAVQLGSDAIFSAAGRPLSLPAHLKPALGVKIYSQIARVAPAPYVEAMLARAAFDRGDLDLARRYALRMPPSAKRSDELGRIAQARGETRAAQKYFIDAADIFAISQYVDALQATDPFAAFALEAKLKDRLELSATHPDAVAEAHWRLGTLAITERRDQVALREFAQAVHLSPLSQKYLLYAGFEAYDLNEAALAARYFERAIGADPSSADAYAGAGLAALRLGQRAAAVADEQRALARDPNSSALRLLQAALR